MNITKMAGLAFGVLVLFFIGFNLSSIMKLAPDDRINEAFPLSDGFLIVKSKLLDQISGQKRRDIEKRLATRMKLRALNCSNGYSPTWFTGKDEIRKNITDRSCFNDADRETVRWLGLVRVGLILAEPPLKPVPSNPESFIIADGTIMNARFARNAGVALVDTYQSVQVLDFEGSKPIFKEPRSSGLLGELSPNGRLFVFGDGSKIRIRDSESGDDITELGSTRPNQFFWVDEHTVFYSSSDGNKTFLVDLDSGREIPIDAAGRSVMFVASVPGKQNQFVLLSSSSATKIELDRTKAEPEVRVIGDKQLNNTFWRGNMPSLTADGSRIFSFSTGVSLLSLDTLDIETISFDPFRIASATVSPDPDKLLLSGYSAMANSRGPRSFLFSTSTQTVIPLDDQTSGRVRYVYIPSIHKLGQIADNKISTIDELPKLEPVALSQFVSNTLQEANQAKLDAFDRQQQMLQQQGTYQGQSGIRTFPSPPWVPGATAPMPALAAPAPESSRSSYGESASRAIAILARGARIDAIGVYHGPRNGSPTAEGRTMGPIDVVVRRASQPIVLVLTSYEPVLWKLKIEPGAKLNAVLVSGYYTSKVTGAEGARVILTGRTYAYKQGGPEYNRLYQEVMLLTGRTPNTFQGQYEGSSFRVGI